MRFAARDAMRWRSARERLIKACNLLLHVVLAQEVESGRSEGFIERGRAARQWEEGQASVRKYEWK